ncbi:MAG: hypothetical protein OXC30_03385 [Alphaproteobacteria bacterium]|nr:hypothetical protein [Alphaproteobacteria bacterium]
MTLILLFFAFLQSYAAQQSPQVDSADFLPKDEVDALRTFETTQTYPLSELHALAKSVQTLLQKRYNIHGGEESLEMHPHDGGFCFSAALLCQAFHLINRAYTCSSRTWGNDQCSLQDKEKYREAYPLIISSAKLFLSGSNSFAQKNYTDWHSTFYRDHRHLAFITQGTI